MKEKIINFLKKMFPFLFNKEKKAQETSNINPKIYTPENPIPGRINVDKEKTKPSGGIDQG